MNTNYAITSGRHSAFRFALLCALLLLAAVWLEPYMGPLNRATANLTGDLLVGAGFSTVVRGDLITVGTFPVQIVTECTSLYALLLFASFALSYPASWRRRATGIFVAASFLTAANLFRIAIVTAVGAVRPSLFEVLHVYFGQVVMLLLVLGCCMTWLRWDDKTSETRCFIFHALCWSTILYTPWVIIHHGYLSVVDTVVKGIFSITDPGLELHLSNPVKIYNHTVAVPLLAALIISTYSVAIRTKIGYGIIGLLILFSWHSLFRMTHVLLSAYGVVEIFPFHQFIYLISQFLLPFLIWRHLSLRSANEANAQ